MALIAAHWPLLRLPYFWDEAGYYIPTARDLLLAGSLIPHSTPSNAHPPLLMAWLALAWKIFGYSPLVARTAMLLIAAFGLLAVFELAREVANREVAIASTLCVALYPVYFAQSSLTHVDLAAAALTLWGILFYVRRRFGLAAVWFALAALAKETAILAPLALFGWELVAGFIFSNPELERGIPTEPETRRFPRICWLLLPLLPLALWFAYHRAKTGYIFGNPDFFRYNVAATLQPVRIALAMLRRGWQLVGHMNLYVLTLATALAMFFPPQPDGSRARQRIAVPTQLAFAAVIIAYCLALSLIGGAVLARYLLPVIPLVIIVCVSTIWRRIRGWQLITALVCAAFVAGLFINPPYVFAPEDNLAYRDYVHLHQDAAQFLAAHDPRARVLTAWPASDELRRPWLGYVRRPIHAVQIENFSREEVDAAAQNAGFDVALIFSTKYEPPHRLPAPAFWQRAQTRFFDYHRDLEPEEAAQILGGEIIFWEKRSGQWVAVIAVSQIHSASLRTRHFSVGVGGQKCIDSQRFREHNSQSQSLLPSSTAS